MTPDQTEQTEQPSRLAALPLFCTPAAPPVLPPQAEQPVPSAPHTEETITLRAVPPMPEMVPATTRRPVLAGPAALPPGAWHPTSSSPDTPSSADTPGRPNMPSPAYPAPTGQVDWGQVRAFRQQAAELLTAQLRDRPGLDDASRREIGRALIVSMLNDHADSLLAQGSPAPSPAAQHALSTAIFDSLFGLGRLQPLVDDPYVENIEIRGYDQVHLVYGDGRVQLGPPVADSDEELIETLAFLASQVPRRCQCEPAPPGPSRAGDQPPSSDTAA